MIARAKLASVSIVKATSIPCVILEWGLALARKVSARWLSSLNLVAVPLKKHMEIVPKKTKMPSVEPQLVFANIADAENHVQNETLKDESELEDEIGTFEQYSDHCPTTKLGAENNITEGRNFWTVASKPARISFDGNIGVGKSTILKLLQSHPLLQQ